VQCVKDMRLIPGAYLVLYTVDRLQRSPAVVQVRLSPGLSLTDYLCGLRLTQTVFLLENNRKCVLELTFIFPVASEFAGIKYVLP
jgi:hypothetical protein